MVFKFLQDNYNIKYKLFIALRLNFDSIQKQNVKLFLGEKKIK